MLVKIQNTIHEIKSQIALDTHFKIHHPDVAAPSFQQLADLETGSSLTAGSALFDNVVQLRKLPDDIKLIQATVPSVYFVACKDTNVADNEFYIRFVHGIHTSADDADRKAFKLANSAREGEFYVGVDHKGLQIGNVHLGWKEC